MTLDELGYTGSHSSTAPSCPWSEIMKLSCVKLASLTVLALVFYGVGNGPLPAADQISYIELDGSSIERLDPQFDKLIADGAKIEKLVEGFEWAEGPVWNRKEGYLLFSDIPNNAVNRWQPGKRLSLFLRPSGYTGRTPREGELGSNGLVYDSQGRLVLCQHGDRRIARLEGKNKFKTLADKFEGKRFNSPNDGVFKSNGDLYFTDPPYGLLSDPNDLELRRDQELDFCGVFRVSTKGKVTLLTDQMTRPNGIAFSPDETILYVAQSDRKAPLWMAFNVAENGTIDKGRTFFDASELSKDKERNAGSPDGLKVDRDGNLFATGPGGVLVFSPDGTHLGTLRTGQATANCAWGDDGSTLYITADMYLCRVKTTTRGLGF